MFPSAYLDFKLMRDVYHCTPDEFDEIDPRSIDLHKSFMDMERRAATIRKNRSVQGSS